MRVAFLFLALTMLAFQGCGNGDEEHNHQPTNPEAGVPATTTGESGLPDMHNREIARTTGPCQDNDCLTVSIQWPEFDNRDALNKAIRKRLLSQLADWHDRDTPPPQTLQAAADDFIQLADGLPDGASRHWQLSAEVTVVARHGAVLTLALSSYRFTGGAHGLPSTHWLNWDLQEQRTLPLSDVIRPDQDTLFWTLAQQAHERWLEDEVHADDAFRHAWPFVKTADYRMSDHGLLLLYQVYAIAPYVTGQIELAIPQDQARAVIRPERQPAEWSPPSPD